MYEAPAARLAKVIFGMFKRIFDIDGMKFRKRKRMRRGSVEGVGCSVGAASGRACRTRDDSVYAST